MPATVTLRIPQTIDDVSLGQFLSYWELRRRIQREEQQGVKWMPRKVARYILSVFSGVDADTLGEVDDAQFQDAFARLDYIGDFHRLAPKGEYSGGTFTVQGEAFTLPDTLDNISAGQYEVIEKTLEGRTMFDVLDYTLAIMTMWDTPNILKHERELHRRAALFNEHLRFVDWIDLAFFLPAGSVKGSGWASRFFMLNARMNQNRMSR